MLRLRYFWLLLTLAAPGCRCSSALVPRPGAEWVARPVPLELPTVFAGQRASASLAVDNLGGVSQTATLEADPPFTLSESTLTLAAGESALLTVEAVPETAGHWAGELRLGTLRVPVSVDVRAVPACEAATACSTTTFDVEAARCVTTPRPDATPCNDGCITGSCHGGVCEGQALGCDDADRCTVDACGPNGCTHVALTCPAPNPCTAPTCSADSGCGVVEAPDGTLCGSDDCRASEVDVCIAGQCVTRRRPDTGRCVNTWVPATLSLRSHHAMAYDSRRERVVLFGGYTTWAYLAETWEWNGTVWEIRTPTASPPTSHRPAMTFDGTRGRTVLVTPLSNRTSQLWEWDGVTWILRSPASMSPPSHGDANYPSLGLAWDAARRVTVATFFRLGQDEPVDTWEWDGVTWRQRHPSTVPRVAYGEAALSWDGTRQRVLLTGQANLPRSHNAVWEWDGSNWADLSATATAVSVWGGHQAAPAWDATRRQLVMKGSLTTYTFDGRTWRELATSAGPRRESPSVFDSARGQLVLFDGEVTWTWNGTEWLMRSREASPELTVLLTAGQTLLGVGNDYGPTLGVWQWNRNGWSRLADSGAPKTRLSFSAAYDAARDRVVVFGGMERHGTPLLAETWEFDGASWLARGTTGPPARASAAMAWDANRQRVVLFGGTGPNNSTLGDAWSWDGTSWQPLSLMPAPPAASFVPLSWDSAQARLMLVGNSAGRTTTDVEAWALTSGGWANVTPTAPPRPATVRAMSEDPERRTLVCTEVTGFNSLATWELSPAGWTKRTPTTSPGTSAFGPQSMAWDPVGRHVMMTGVGQTWLFIP